MILPRSYGVNYLAAAPSRNNYGKISVYYDGHGDHYGSFSSGGDCCPLVVDPLDLLALIAFIALATYFFQVQIDR